MRILVTLLLLGALCPQPAALARDFHGLLTEAEQYSQRGKPLDAVASLRLALAKLWNRMPVAIKKAVLVKNKASGYGQYSPRGGNIYTKGEPVYIYVEPVGYRFTSTNGGQRFGFTADFMVTTDQGSILGGKKDFQTWQFSSKEPLFEMYVNLTYTLTGAPPGQYIIETTFKDLGGGGNAVFKTPIVIK